jgi:hypothetical protein
MKIMIAFVSTTLSVIFLFLTYKDRDATRVKDQKICRVHDSTTGSVYDSIPKPIPLRVDLKVSTYHIYDDGALSTFDVLNDKTIAL